MFLGIIQGVFLFAEEAGGVIGEIPTIDIQALWAEFYANNQALITTVINVFAILFTVLKNYGVVNKVVDKFTSSSSAVGQSLAKVAEYKKVIEDNSGQIVSLAQQVSSLAINLKNTMAVITTQANMLLAIAKNSNINLNGLSEITDIAVKLQMIQKGISDIDEYVVAQNSATTTLVQELQTKVEKTPIVEEKKVESASSAVTAILGGE